MAGSLAGAVRLLLVALAVLFTFRCKPDRLTARGSEPVWLGLCAIGVWSGLDFLHAGGGRWLDIWGVATTLGGIAVLVAMLALARSQRRPLDVAAVTAVAAGIAIWIGLAAIGVGFGWEPVTERLALSDETSLWAGRGLDLTAALWAAAALWRTGSATVPDWRWRRGAWVALSALAGALVLPARPVIMGADNDEYQPGLLYRASTYVHDLVVTPGPRRRRPPPIDVEATYYAQPELMRAALASLKPSRADRPEIYFLAAATFGGEGVFRREVESAAGIVEERLGTAGRTLMLVNSRETLARVPLANVTNLEAALEALGRIMDPAKDVLFLYITSHGSPGQIAVQLDGFSPKQITPERLAAMLQRSGIRHRLVVLSACYAGSFVPALATPDTVVMTAARADRTSFGCSDEREWTYFGDALFNHALRQTVSPLQAFQWAKALVAQWEGEQKMLPSEPQIAIGGRAQEAIEKAVAALRKEAATPPPPAVPAAPPASAAPSASAASEPRAEPAAGGAEPSTGEGEKR